MERGRQERQNDDEIFDVYAKAEEWSKICRKKTGLTYDDTVLAHKCEWNPFHQECPGRYVAAMNRFAMYLPHNYNPFVLSLQWCKYIKMIFSHIHVSVQTF